MYFIFLVLLLDEAVFSVYDAKYYNIQFEFDADLKGVPRVKDIAKQYIYQLAYSDFIRKNNITKVYDSFIMPREGNKVIKKGHISIEMFKGLENINIILVPAKKAYECFFNDKEFVIEMEK